MRATLVTSLLIALPVFGALAATTGPGQPAPNKPLAPAASTPPTAAAPAMIPVGPLPRAFAGYAQPLIPASACKIVSITEAQCQIPAMTAGRYLVEASGTSTSQGADAAQALEIDVGGRQCGVGKNTAAWPSGARTFRLDCEVALLTDTPLIVRVVYADAKATKDPKGPTVSIRPMPWNGVLGSQPFVPKQ